MRRTFLLLHLSAVLFANDPPYFESFEVNGFYVAGLSLRLPAKVNPGSLDACKQTFVSAGYATWECGLQNASFELNENGKKLLYPMTKLSVLEYQSDPKSPSMLTYYFSGGHSEKLPDASELTSIASLTLERVISDPNKVAGTFSLGHLNVEGFFQGLLAVKIRP